MSSFIIPIPRHLNILFGHLVDSIEVNLKCDIEEISVSGKARYYFR
jgi:hypothetical protein